jgi:malate dehydrogenase (oxaloacetate-decarboxylating)
LSKISPYFDYQVDESGKGFLSVNVRGMEVLRLTATNKGTAFTYAEREALGLDGLLPAAVVTLDDQVNRLYKGFQRQVDDIEKYQFLRALQERNEVAFYALLERHLEEMMPIVYTPTVGKAVQQFSALYKIPRGLTISPQNIERIDQCLDNYPWNDVRIIVATDASAILGIGDQGHGGLAICVGKLALYTSGGGISPFHTMPVNLDVGTDSRKLLDDPTYLGIKQPRLSGKPYFELMDRFVDHVEKKWPKAVIQWEDFSRAVAFQVLERYQHKIPCFNDDIQGTGAVVLAGLLSACKMKNESIADQRVVLVGAGAGGVGVARAIKAGMMKAGLSDAQARKQLFVIDIEGLLVDGKNIEPYMQSVSQFESTFADWGIEGEVPTLNEVIRYSGATALMGFTGCAGLFTLNMVQQIHKNTAQPIIFPLSNPNANCEATPQDLADWTQGQAILATGSPFPPVTYDDRDVRVGQGNNAFVFPGIGFAAVLGKCKRISEDMVLESAYALSDYTEEHYLAKGMIYPPIAELREVSIQVTTRVLQTAFKDGSSGREEIRNINLEEYVRSRSWDAKYLPFVAA